MKLELTKKNNTFKNRKKNYQFNPMFFWQLLIVLTFLLLIFAAIFGYWNFMKVNKEPSIENESKVPLLVTEERINKALQVFKTRADTREKIIYTPSLFADPSR
jgi:hypothetical protein